MIGAILLIVVILFLLGVPVGVQSHHLHCSLVLAAYMAMWLITRSSAWRRTHPMSGGVRRVRLDRVDEFLPLLRRTYEFELAPLPRSSQLSAAEGLLKLPT